MPLQIVRNDITRMQVDAIVNAANETLLGGGGVDGSIHRAAGPELLAECRTLGGCATGQAKVTRGYRLPARYVIHTVGPIWHGGGQGEAELLASCYRNCLETALKLNCESIAFPFISTGAYGYPKELAMPIAVEEISRFLMAHEMQVYLVVFGPSSLAVSKKLFDDVREYIDETYVDEHYNRPVESARRILWHENAQKARDYDLILSDTFADAAPAPCAPMPEQPDWGELLRRTDEGFAGMLLRKIDEKGMTDAQCYKKANVDRKLFNKIKNSAGYKPGKTTVLAFAVALELDLDETKELLEKAGFALSHSSKLDIVVEYFILHHAYDIMEINQVLFQFDLPLLGSAVQ